MSTDTYTYARDPPTVARVERRGRDLLIKSPDEFLDWLGEPPAGVELDGRVSEETATETSEGESTGGVLGRVRGLFS
jgi:hypothetical protein